MIDSEWGRAVSQDWWDLKTGNRTRLKTPRTSVFCQWVLIEWTYRKIWLPENIHPQKLVVSRGCCRLHTPWITTLAGVGQLQNQWCNHLGIPCIEYKMKLENLEDPLLVFKWSISCHYTRSILHESKCSSYLARSFQLLLTTYGQDSNYCDLIGCLCIYGLMISRVWYCSGWEYIDKLISKCTIIPTKSQGMVYIPCMKEWCCVHSWAHKFTCIILHLWIMILYISLIVPLYLYVLSIIAMHVIYANKSWQDLRQYASLITKGDPQAMSLCKLPIFWEPL